MNSSGKNSIWFHFDTDGYDISEKVWNNSGDSLRFQSVVSDPSLQRFTQKSTDRILISGILLFGQSNCSGQLRLGMQTLSIFHGPWLVTVQTTCCHLCFNKQTHKRLKITQKRGKNFQFCNKISVHYFPRGGFHSLQNWNRKTKCTTLKDFLSNSRFQKSARPHYKGGVQQCHWSALQQQTNRISLNELFQL